MTLMFFSKKKPNKKNPKHQDTSKLNSPEFLQFYNWIIFYDFFNYNAVSYFNL